MAKFLAKQRDTEWITTTEAALRIGQSAQAIRDGIKAGKYEGHKVKDHVGKRWIWMVDAKTLPTQEVASLAKQSQTLSLSDEDREAVAEALFGMLAPEVVSKVEPIFSDMAKQLGECNTLLKELKENTAATEELRAKVEAYEEQARKRSWWRSLLGGGPE